MESLTLETAANAVSMLPHLEPLAGAGLGVNLAYLALERFRHREAIRKYAQEKLAPLQNKDDASIIGSSQYRHVKWLASLPNNEPAPAASKVGHTDNQDSSLITGAWKSVYKFGFSNHLDRRIAKAFVGVASLVLFFIAAEQINLFSLGSTIWIEGSVGIVIGFGVLVVSFLWPLLCIWAGKKVVDWGRLSSEQCIRELLEILKKEPKTAQVPQRAAPIRTLPRPSRRNDDEIPF